MCNFHR